MTSRERIYAAINNQPVDRIPFSFWRHFPKEEETAHGLAKAVISFQKKFNFDLVKITPAASSITQAWGSKYIYRDDEEGIQKGVRSCVFSPVNSYNDWSNIRRMKVEKTILSGEVEAVKIIRQNIDKSIPIVHTVPSPLTVAKMLNGENWINDLREHPQYLTEALTEISETIKNFIKLLLHNGADGIFFYTHGATHDFLVDEEYKIFGRKFDLDILNEAKKETDLLILHIHGINIMFDMLKDYPVQMINWHDRLTAPTLREAKKVFNGALLGGIDEWNVLMKMDPEKTKEQVRDAISQTKGRGLIIGPGCIIPTDTPMQNMEEIRKVL